MKIHIKKQVCLFFNNILKNLIPWLTKVASAHETGLISEWLESSIELLCANGHCTASQDSDKDMDTP